MWKKLLKFIGLGKSPKRFNPNLSLRGDEIRTMSGRIYSPEMLRKAAKEYMKSIKVM